jgi:hypothetical protein
VIDDDLGAFDGLERRSPARQRLFDASEEDPAVLLEGLAKLGGDADQSVEDVLGHDRRQPGVERVVGIAEGMHVAHRAVYPR